jgi:hypothetical protein
VGIGNLQTHKKIKTNRKQDDQPKQQLKKKRGTMHWFEDTPTMNNFGHLYGEHDGAPDTAHKFRWIYPDRTPVIGELGEWVTCTHCTETLQEEWA